MTAQVSTARGRQVSGRSALVAWQQSLQETVFSPHSDFAHSIRFHIDHHKLPASLLPQLEALGIKVAAALEPLASDNDQRLNLPRIEHYDGVGEWQQQVVHHPLYAECGDLIYGSGLMGDLAGGDFTAALSKFFLLCHAGEAGHNCPVACSAGIIRILQHADLGDAVSLATTWLGKLTMPSYRENFTGAQFVTEVQGGSDVGQNDTLAQKDAVGHWRVYGEKWFCSNANADLILMTARVKTQVEGTAGVSLFLVPAVLEDGSQNRYRIRRLKEKLGTRSMASGEIDFDGARAYAVGDPEQPKAGFKLLMEHVLHLSRILNGFAATGAARRAFQVAQSYAVHREAFGQAIGKYPLVQMNLTTVRAENTALVASVLRTCMLQQQADADAAAADDPRRLLLRGRVNISKFMTSKYSVEHIHHCIDVLAGNGTIETFSPLPRLLRDSIVYENWEGTHNTLFMQMLRDILRYQIDAALLNDLEESLAGLAGRLDDADFAGKLELALASCKDQSALLRQAEAAEQTLLIADWVRNMGWLDAIIALTAEGLHQQQVDDKQDKLTMAKWLIDQHQPEPVRYQTQLTMLEKLALSGN